MEIAWVRREKGKLGPSSFSEHRDGIQVFGRSGPRGDSASGHCSELGLFWGKDLLGNLARDFKCF